MAWLIIIAICFAQFQAAFAWKTIAHRGLSHDTDDRYVLAENTFAAVRRAAEFGLSGVELDIQVSEDGVPFVAHDKIGLRETTNDGYDGLLNPVDVLLKSQPQGDPVKYSEMPFSFWNLRPSKEFGRNAQIVKGAVPEMLESLEAILGHVNDLNKPEFLVVLDIQSPAALRTSAALITKLGMEQQVMLKPFAVRAFDWAKHNYTGPETCARIAQEEGFTGLQYIPQFNDGQMTPIPNEPEAFIDVFTANITINQYLDCWSSADIQMPMVAASVPQSSHANAPFAAASKRALEWASAHGKYRMSIVSNPSVGRVIRGRCTYFTFNVNKAAAKNFNQSNHDAKSYFADRFLRDKDFCVEDVMGDVGNRRWGAGFEFYTANLC